MGPVVSGSVDLVKQGDGEIGVRDATGRPATAVLVSPSVYAVVVEVADWTACEAGRVGPYGMG
ncbi:hypothetical protein B5D80_28155 [Micromonospora wenchangensis]|uniref:Uncharacterized protein n=1 Tax=Micromonospora wenchangensis TaxID=1185415 RepID=A0A246REG4_9ACTN|nr:hypothetical protein B5D80_28155 [Micromonospora wenchangensis]